MPPIVVVGYDSTWPEVFAQISSRVWPVVRDVALAIEHVGSTAVPGLAAKPIVDIDIVVRDALAVSKAIERLATLGYAHRGNLGAEGREAFNSPTGLPRHHLYVCPEDSLALKNHLAFRNFLRTNPGEALKYGQLKRELAIMFADDIDSYIAGKTPFILDGLRSLGFTDEHLEEIFRINRVTART
jgi:GrpB-like predicted nucleotidyltransferase (UPF0157 family)